MRYLVRSERVFVHSVGLEGERHERKHKNAGLFPRGGPDVFICALLLDPGDHLGSGENHVAFGFRFYLEVDAV